MAKFIKKDRRWYYYICDNEQKVMNELGFKTKKEAEIAALMIELKLIIKLYIMK